MAEILSKNLPEINKLAEGYDSVKMKLRYRKLAFLDNSEEISERPICNATITYDPNKPDACINATQLVHDLDIFLESIGIPTRVELRKNTIGTKVPSGLKVMSLMNLKAPPEDFVVKPGEVTLLIFTIKNNMNDNMDQLYKKLVVNHPEWKGKLRIVGITFAGCREESARYIENSGWTFWEQYDAGDADSEFCKALEISGSRFQVLIDQNGLIQFSNYSEEHNIEEYITQLINGQVLKEPSQKIKATYMKIAGRMFWEFTRHSIKKLLS